MDWFSPLLRRCLYNLILNPWSKIGPIGGIKLCSKSYKIVYFLLFLDKNWAFTLTSVSVLLNSKARLFLILDPKFSSSVQNLHTETDIGRPENLGPGPLSNGHY